MPGQDFQPPLNLERQGKEAVSQWDSWPGPSHCCLEKDRLSTHELALASRAQVTSKNLPESVLTCTNLINSPSGTLRQGSRQQPQERCGVGEAGAKWHMEEGSDGGRGVCRSGNGRWGTKWAWLSSVLPGPWPSHQVRGLTVHRTALSLPTPPPIPLSLPLCPL